MSIRSVAPLLYSVIALSAGCTEFVGSVDLTADVASVIEVPATMQVGELAFVAVDVLIGGRSTANVELEWTTDAPGVLAVAPDSSTRGSELMLAGLTPGTAVLTARIERAGVNPLSVSDTVVVEQGSWPTALSVIGRDTVAVLLTNTDSSVALAVDVGWRIDDTEVAKVVSVDRLRATVTAHSSGLATLTATVDRPGSPPQEISTAIVVSALGVEPDTTAHPWSPVLSTRAMRPFGVLVTNQSTTPAAALSIGWSTSDRTVLEVTPTGDPTVAQVRGLETGTADLIARVQTPGFEVAEFRSPVVVEQGWTVVAAGQDFTCGSGDLDGPSYCWGRNVAGRLGTGGSGSEGAPARVATQVTFEQLSLGATHACGLASGGGSVFCWGANEEAQYGTGGSGLSRSLPLEPVNHGALFAPPLDVRTVSAGGYHNCAVDQSNVVWCWGQNLFGQVGTRAAGDPTQNDCLAAIGGGLPCAFWAEEVAGTYVQVDLAANYSCALGADSLAYCWGDNRDGAVGPNANDVTSCPEVCARFPVVVDHARTFSTITAGESHACGLSGGVAYCWGDNSTLQLGRTGAGSSTPSVVPNAPAFRDVQAGDGVTCGWAMDETAYCWGRPIGDSTAANLATPTPVFGDRRFSGGIAVGWNHACGIDQELSFLYCWGDGFGGAFATTAPVRVLEPRN